MSVVTSVAVAVATVTAQFLIDIAARRMVYDTPAFVAVRDEAAAANKAAEAEKGRPRTGPKSAYASGSAQGSKQARVVVVGGGGGE
jgi:hypothetical protein